MQTSEALKIIQALADGVNPITGEVFLDDSPHQHPQIIRALFAAAKSLEKLEKNEERQKRERDLPENAGKAWDAEEDKLLCAGFDAGMTIIQLAQKHKRTNGSIQSRLVRLGKIEPTFSSSPAGSENRPTPA